MSGRSTKRKKKKLVKPARRSPNPEFAKQQRLFVDSVAKLAEPLCAAEGLELVHVEYQREPGGVTLRIYLDGPGGITLDDCVAISRQLGDVLDVHLKDAPPYRLEVSSPGSDRPLGKVSDFERFAGHRAKIRMAEAINGRKNFTGILDGVVDDSVRMQLDGQTVWLNYNEITRAWLINYNGEQ